MLFVFLVYTSYIYHVFGKLKEYIWSLSLRTMESRREFSSFGLSIPLRSILKVSSHVHKHGQFKVKAWPCQVYNHYPVKIKSCTTYTVVILLTLGWGCNIEHVLLSASWQDHQSKTKSAHLVMIVIARFYLVNKGGLDVLDLSYSEVMI